MTNATPFLVRARAGDEEAFRELTDPYRRELQLHCYRILGSMQDAEDLLQETLLAAWRGLEGFEGRSSMRTWLYRIATNRSLNALRDSGRRPQEVPMRADLPTPTRITEPLFLEPYPDVLLESVPDSAAGPEARYELKESIALAFVAGLQRLPPRQRAVLVLRDVLGFPAAEVAEMLEVSDASVTSALQRAREALRDDDRIAARERVAMPRSERERELVARFAEAFSSGDIDGVVALLTEDANLSMPPEPGEYGGRAAIRAFLLNRIREPRPAGTVRLVPTRANGQPAFGYYLRDPTCGIARCNGIIVLTIVNDGISALTRFGDTGLLPHFGLPRSLRV
jgi:RNA polymerase sigma-70 factor (TIGR02960 family)